MKKQVQKTFSAWDLCKAKDTCHQGCLNLQGIEAVRNVENLEKYKRGLIPSKSTVWRKVNELLKEVGDPTFDVTHRDECSFGEAFELGFEKVIRYTLLVNGLLEIARIFSVELGFSVDAGSLSGNTTHIFGGCKNLDSRSTNRNGKLKFIDHEKDDGIICYNNLQSNSNVYFLQITHQILVSLN